MEIIGTWNGWTVVRDAAGLTWLVNPLNGHKVRLGACGAPTSAREQEAF